MGLNWEGAAWSPRPSREKAVTSKGGSQGWGATALRRRLGRQLGDPEVSKGGA